MPSIVTCPKIVSNNPPFISFYFFPEQNFIIKPFLTFYSFQNTYVTCEHTTFLKIIIRKKYDLDVNGVNLIYSPSGISLILMNLIG